MIKIKEIKNKKPIMHLINGADMLKEPKNPLHNDSSYRRGYLHGYDSGMDDTKSGKNVIKFFNNELMKWRYGKTPYKDWDELQFPPKCPIKTNNKGE